MPDEIIEKKERGRPTVFTPEVIDKLEEAFSIGATDEEACALAGISLNPLYEYQRVNPKFLERKRELKELLILKARRTVVGSLNNPEMAWKFLTKKRKEEFGEPSSIPPGIPQDTLEAILTKKSFTVSEETLRLSNIKKENGL